MPRRQPSPAFAAVQIALSAIDRLEVRGRDSAGLHLLVWGHGLDLGSDAVRRLLAGRDSDALFGSGSVRAAEGNLAFVYKAAKEIGELGDNTAALRAAIAADGLLHLALAAPTARVTVLGHTRWASVGIISEANAHPLNQEEEGDRRPVRGRRAERRRRQPRRPQGEVRVAHPRLHHDRREGHPRARVPPGAGHR